MSRTLLASMLALGACGGGSKQTVTTPPPPAAAHGLMIADDIDCPKLVNHMVDIHAAANPEKAAANPDAIAKIRVDTIKECEDRYGKTPPTESEKTSARCSMKAATTDELSACGS